MSANVQNIIAQIMSLSPEEQAALRGLLAGGSITPSPPTVWTEEDEDRLEQQLLAEGTLDYLPPKNMDLTPLEGRTPAKIVGISASDFLISERR